MAAAPPAPPPRPKSPPATPDPCGRHRLQLAVDALHREIGFLEVHYMHTRLIITTCCRTCIAHHLDVSYILMITATMHTHDDDDAHLRLCIAPPSSHLHATPLSLSSPARRVMVRAMFLLFLLRCILFSFPFCFQMCSVGNCILLYTEYYIYMDEQCVSGQRNY
jgi:hypothetical protein